MYHVLRTVAEDGTSLTMLPTEERIVSSTESYAAALTTARQWRTTACQHRTTGEVRLLNDDQVAGCARTNPDLFRWIANADVLHHGGYALVVEDGNLCNYAPRQVERFGWLGWATAGRGASQVDKAGA